MPEDPENQDIESVETTETTENEESSGEPEGEPTDSKGPKHIPYDRFQEVWQERQDARGAVSALQQQILMLQNQILATQHSMNTPRDPDPDPDVEQIVAPVLNKYVKPLVQQLNAAKQELYQVQARNEAEQAWNYVLQHVPDMDDLKEDLAREIEAKPRTVQQKITSDPDLVIELAEKVRLKRASGNVTTGNAGRADLKSRTKSESGGQRTNPSNSRVVDWASLSDEEFQKEYARVQRQKVAR